MWPRLSVPLLLAALSLACRREEKRASVAKEPLQVAAASDLSFAFRDVGAAYEKATGRKVVFSFGSTGLLARQIAEGAPFDVFAAANTKFVDDVVAAGACSGETKALYGLGRIVLWTKKGALPPKRLEELADGRFAKIALAQPEHAPYGRAAMEALTKSGLRPLVEKRLVYGENVQQAMRYAETGNADVAFVALSLALATEGGDFLRIDPTIHAPLEQAIVACHMRPDSGAKEFLSLVASQEGRAIMQRHGFSLPGESGGP